MGQAKKKQRDCPAVGRTIGAAECGEHRQSRYACPAECPYNPWSPANYDRALDVEDGLRQHVYRRLARELTDAGQPPAPPATDPLVTQERVLNWLFFERDAQGHTFAQRWEHAGLAELNNDERVLWRWSATMQPTLLEIQAVLDERRCRAVDLLEPGCPPFIICDWSLAGSAVRFSHALTWSFRMPHYRRLHGAAVSVPEVSVLEPDEVVRVTAAFLGAPPETAALRGWLTTNMVRVAGAFGATLAAFRWRMFEGLDARYGKATYRLRSTPAEVRRQLDGMAAVSRESPAAAEQAEGFGDGWVWFDEPAPLEPGQIALPLASGGPAVAGRPSLGRVLFGAETVRIEAGSGVRYAALRAAFERRFGRAVEFQHERVDDLAAQVLKRSGKRPDLSLVPPVLLERSPRIHMQTSRIEVRAGETGEAAGAAAWRARMQHFLDERLPALDEHTPREAAADPALRRRLIRVVKGHVRHHDEHNLRNGNTEDINWLVRDLGLTEIDFPPPPPRPVPPEPEFAGEAEGGSDEGEEGDAADFTGDEEDDDRPWAPPLPPGPLSEAEFERRVKLLAEECSELERVVFALQDQAPEAYELLDALLPEELNDFEYMAGLTVAAQLWFLLFPSGTRGPAVAPADVTERVVRITQTLPSPLTPDSLMRLFTESPQPALATVAGEQLANLTKARRKDARIRAEQSPFLLMLMLGLIEAWDAAGRRLR